jgi:hypothetical protein
MEIRQYHKLELSIPISKTRKIVMVHAEHPDVKVVITLNKHLNKTIVRTYGISTTRLNGEMRKRGETEPWNLTYMEGLRLLVQLKNWYYTKAIYKNRGGWEKRREKKKKIIAAFKELHDRIVHARESDNPKYWKEHWLTYYMIPNSSRQLPWEAIKDMSFSELKRFYKL